MSFKKRIAILGLLAFLFLGAFIVSRQYSPAIIAYVVEEALLQKAPDSIGREQTQRRFRAWQVAAKPEDRVMKLLELSKYLEKVQKLSPLELEQLLEDGAGTQKPRS